MTIRPGLCSVTFRSLDVDQLVDRAAAHGIEAVEWGADVHVLPGDDAAADRARERCVDAGIDVASYGSYLLAGQSPAGDAEAVWAAAERLGAPNVRVWSAFGVGPDAQGEERAPVAAQLGEWAAAAADRGLALSLEFHPGTLTETAESTLRLVAAVGHPNLSTYWQPVAGDPPDRSLAEAIAVFPHLSHLHVFEWASGEDRRPLAEGADRWPPVLAAASAEGGDRVAFLEFVRGDDPDQFAADTATLRHWLTEL